MKYKQSLSFRIRFSFILFGALLSIALASGVHIAIQGIENQLLKDGLTFKLKHFREQTNKQLGQVSQIGPDSKIYYVSEAQRQQLPHYLRKLGVGKHAVRGERDFYILVAKVDGHWTYVVTDSTLFEHRERAIELALIISVLASILIAAWLGWWISARVISPVSNLAQQVSQLTPGENKTKRVATQYAHDEVGELAATFDRYLDQIEQFIQREQAFTADASHELRTPLAIINGATELLLDNPDMPKRAHDQIERIARAGQRMALTVDSLLMLARENGATQRIDNEKCQAQSVIAEVIDANRPLVEQKAIALRAEVLTDLELPATKTLLAIVLNNLVKNAIAHTHTGEVVIKAEARWIEVCDTGSGIAPQDLPHVFNRHYRGQSTPSAGSGLGLSIVKRICDRHHWKINIDSQTNTGTCIRLEF